MVWLSGTLVEQLGRTAQALPLPEWAAVLVASAVRAYEHKPTMSSSATTDSISLRPPATRRTLRERGGAAWRPSQRMGPP